MKGDKDNLPVPMRTLYKWLSLINWAKLWILKLGSCQIRKVSFFCLLCISKSTFVTVATCKFKLILCAPKTRVLQIFCPTTGDEYQQNWIGSCSKIRDTGDDLMYLFQMTVECLSFWCEFICHGAGKLYCFRVSIFET